MHFGGWEGDDRSCGDSCDGMPLPDDPDWKLEADSHGCAHWTNPHGIAVSGGTGAIGYCGVLRPDGGTPGDASQDSPGDSPADASAD